MPYISTLDDRREKLRNGKSARNAGELNYQIFYYYKHNKYISNLHLIHFVAQFLGEKPNYQRYNDMTGVMIRCAREINRRLGINAYKLVEVMDSFDDEIAEYEDIKIKQNGDVE